MARTELIKFRVTAAEKAYLVTQAGGARRLSEHLRSLSLKDFEDQAHRASRSLPVAEAPGDDVSSGDRKTSGGGGPETCPRWMHHRSGTYCGSCKTVPK